jgi:hypothetical protein
MERTELAACLNHRVNDFCAAAALASIATDAIGRSIFLWEHEEKLSLGDAFDVIWEGVIAALALLAPSQPS